jgi:hypothetical protein
MERAEEIEHLKSSLKTALDEVVSARQHYRKIERDEDLSVVHPHVFAQLKEVVSRLEQAKTIRNFRRGAKDLKLITDDLSILIPADRDVERDGRDIVRDVGKRLNELGGTELMHRVIDEVTEPIDQPEYGRVCSIVGHAWNGIGDWLA